MIKKLILFTYNECKYCKSLMKRLDDNHIPYFNFDVIKNRTEWLEIVSRIGIDIVPTIYIKENDNDSGKFYQPNRDYKDEDEIFEIIKNHSNKE